jgi:neutral amino acid transport system permease protein
MQGYVVSLIIFTSIFAVFGLGLNLQWGFTGLINFGHVAFMSLGAYTTVLLSLQGIPLLFSMLAGAIVAAGMGLLIGFSTLRLRTDYLAIVTIGVSEILRLIAVNETWLTRGTFGIQRFPLPLATFNPPLSLRIGIIVLLLGVLALGYWQWGKWLVRQTKGTVQEGLIQGSIAAFVYVGSGALLVYGIGITARSLKQSNAFPAWVLGLGLLTATIAGIGLYVWLARRVMPKITNWSMGLTVVCNVIIALLGLWIARFAISAVYQYDRNPSKTGLMVISVLLVALIYWALEKLVRSPWGRVLKAIREDEEVAKALGKNVFWYKLQSLMLGGAIAGIAGALYAWQLTTVFPDNFQPLVTFNAWTIVVLGGAGSNAGTLLGSAIFWAYDTITRFVLRDIVPLEDARLGAFRIMVIGLILMVLMIWRPQGILGKKEELTLGR